MPGSASPPGSYATARPHPDAWVRAAYTDQPLITRVGALHADHATSDDRPTGLPTSSAIAPGVIVRMLRHTRLTDDGDVLEVSAGTGYGAVVLCERSGYRQVTTIEADEYLTKAAGERLAGIGLHPRVGRGDPCGPLPGRFDRIASMAAVRPVPASWLAALHPGGRLVTPIAGTALILTADKTPDGGATGRTEWDRGAFMPAGIDADAPAIQPGLLATVREADGADVTTGRYPVVNVARAWDLYSALGIIAPDIQHGFAESADGRRTRVDGARGRFLGPCHQRRRRHAHRPPGRPRRLWDILEGIRLDWLRDGSLPVHGADVTITADGTICLQHGHWQATLPASPNGPPPA